MVNSLCFGSCAASNVWILNTKLTWFLKLLVFLFIATTFDISLVLYNLNLRQHVITEIASNELSLNYIKTNTRVRYRLCMTICVVLVNTYSRVVPLLGHNWTLIRANRKLINQVFYSLTLLPLFMSHKRYTPPPPQNVHFLKPYIYIIWNTANIFLNKN